MRASKMGANDNMGYPLVRANAVGDILRYFAETNLAQTMDNLSIKSSTANITHLSPEKMQQIANHQNEMARATSPQGMVIG